MPVSDLTARPNAVKIPGLVEHYTTTLQGRGYGPVATHAYKRALNISLPGPRPIPIASRSDEVRFGASLMSTSVAVPALVVRNVAG